MAGRLTDSHKRYILEHYKTTSKNQLAKTLGISKRDIIEFLKKPGQYNETNASTHQEQESCITKYNSFIWILLFIGVIAFSAFLRIGTFYHPHDNGDQVFYTAVAMKLDKFGFKGYNLRGITILDKKDTNSLEILYTSNYDYTLLAAQKSDGFTFYDEPVFYAPPLLPYLIKFSHDIFAKGKSYLYVDGGKLINSPKTDYSKFLKTDFYRNIIPFFFSILTIIVLFIFCKSYLNERIAIYSAILLSVSPIDILCSNRIWADSILTFFVLLSIIFFYIAVEKDNFFYAVSSGACCGLAILAKASGLSVLAIVGIYQLWVNKGRMRNFKEIIHVLFDKKLLAFGLVAFLITLPWFLVITKTFGTPFHIPYQANVEEINSWFKLVRNKPWYIYLVDIPYQNPLFLLSFAAFFFAFKNNKTKFLSFTWLLIFLIYLTFFMAVKENRYMLPTYPALAILAGCVLYRIREAVSWKFGKRASDILISIFLIASSVWSVKIAFEYVFILQDPLLSLPI